MWNYKTKYLIQKKPEREKNVQRIDGTSKATSWMIDLNLTISIITLDVNSLENTNFNREIVQL